MTARTLFALLFAAAATAGCSSQQTYASGQAWQQNQCQKILDMQERERCLAPTRESYDSYQRKAGELKKGNAAE